MLSSAITIFGGPFGRSKAGSPGEIERPRPWFPGVRSDGKGRTRSNDEDAGDVGITSRWTILSRVGPRRNRNSFGLWPGASGVADGEIAGRPYGRDGRAARMIGQVWPTSLAATPRDGKIVHNELLDLRDRFSSDATRALFRGGGSAVPLRD